MRIRPALSPLVGALLLAALVALPASAQERANDEARSSPNAIVGQTIGTTDVVVTYGRPSVRERDVFGDLVPYDAVWRTGANEATTVSFSDDVTVEGEPLAAGTYSLFTIPGEGAWTVIFNRTATQWGAFRYDDGEDALRVSVAPVEIASQEQLLIAFSDVTADSAMMHLHWDTVGVPIAIGASE